MGETTYTDLANTLFNFLTSVGLAYAAYVLRQLRSEAYTAAAILADRDTQKVIGSASGGLIDNAPTNREERPG